MSGTNKYLIVSSEFPPAPGGIGNHAYNLAMGLFQKKHSVHVISIYRNLNADNEFDLELPFPVERVMSGKFFAKTKLIFKTIKKLSTDSNLTVIASGLAMLIICGLYSSIFQNGKTKFVLIAHGIDINPSSVIYKSLVSITINRFDRIIAVSSYTAGKIKGVHKSKIKVINNGFNPKQIDENGMIAKPHDEYPSLLTVGSVTYRKGQINVIRALPFLVKKYPKIHYHMVGIDKDKNELITLAKKLDVVQYITFHGPLSNKLLHQQLLKTDIFLMLSNHTKEGDFEGFGIAVLEANFLGIPAVGALESGLVDAIKDGDSGILINPQNVEELLIAIPRLLSDLDRYRERAKAHSLTFLWDKVINRYCEVL